MSQQVLSAQGNQRNKGAPGARQLACVVSILLHICARVAPTEPILASLEPRPAHLKGVSPRSLLKPLHELGPDAFADPPEMIRSRKFLAEVHRVTTADKYMLTLHRVVNPLVPERLRHRLKPVLLQHGLFTSASTFLVASDANNDRPRFDAHDLARTWPEAVYSPQAPFSWLRLVGSLRQLKSRRVSDSLALEMANQGYDVWLGNSRGSTYSLGHARLDWRRDWRYWDFSFHEMGLFDAPAQIDYILRARNKRSLAYVGHSQGNLAMFVLQSLRPEWRHKVKPFVALSPIAYVPDVYYGALRLLIRLVESTLITSTQLNRVLKGRALPKAAATSRALDLVCLPKWSTRVCSLALSLITGDNMRRSNSSMVPTIAHHIPEGTSILNLLHFGQMIASAQFRAFDFGPRDNVRRYGRPDAPLYPLANIQSPDIAFVVGRTDTLSTPVNVELTRLGLTVPLLDYHIVADPSWGHADHTYAIGAGNTTGAHVISLLDRYRLVDV